jgi:hypothetical protein
MTMASIDKIQIIENGATKNLTPDQWKAIPLTQRVTLLRGDVKFYSGATSVPAKEAIGQLR